MRRSIGAVLSAVAAMSLTALASASSRQTGISTVAPSVEIKDYLAAVHALSRYEVDSSRLALTKSKAQALRSFAQAMINHHTRGMTESARLLKVPGASDSGSALVGPLSEMLNSLENVPPADFDVAYRRGQIAAHEEALKVQSAFAERGVDPAMRAKARTAAPSIQEHLEAARKLPGG